MLNLEDLQQFVSFYEYGTLTKVAEEYHISQPSITRTMKRVEEAFGVPLFQRSANRIEFNEVGLKAVEQAKELLAAADRCVGAVADADRKLRTISVISCAPAPLWTLLPELSRTNPDKTISSNCTDNLAWIESEFISGSCDQIILPYPLDIPGTVCEKYADEHLYLCVKDTHVLAKEKQLTMDQINGFNCLLYSDIGFWTNLCKKLMPSSRFLIQTERFTFDELVRESNLPCFATNYTDRDWAVMQERTWIPITDKDVNVTYYLIKRK